MFLLIWLSLAIVFCTTQQPELASVQEGAAEGFLDRFDFNPTDPPLGGVKYYLVSLFCREPMNAGVGKPIGQQEISKDLTERDHVSSMNRLSKTSTKHLRETLSTVSPPPNQSSPTDGEADQKLILQSGNIYSAKEMIAWILTFGIVSTDLQEENFNAINEGVIEIVGKYDELAQKIKATKTMCTTRLSSDSPLVLRSLLLWMIEILLGKYEPMSKDLEMAITISGEEVLEFKIAYAAICKEYKIRYEKENVNDERYNLLQYFKNQLQFKTHCSYFFDVFGPYKHSLLQYFPNTYGTEKQQILNIENQRHFLYNLVYLGVERKKESIGQ